MVRILLTLVGLMPISIFVAQTPVNDAIASHLQSRLDSCVQAFNLPGISASMILGNDEYWNGVSGLADIYEMTPMESSLLFQQASVTKMYATAVIFQLIDEGLLSLEDPVSKFLPTIPYIPGNTKVRYLLNHRSGIFNFIGGNPDAGDTWFTDPDSIWDPIRAITIYGRSPNFTQGAGFEYSNTNFILLGMIVEAITGTTFAEALRSRILEPHGLNETFMPHIDSIAGPLVKGWTSWTSLQGPYTTDASVIFNTCSASMVSTAGALVASPRDVARFTRLLWSGEIVSQNSLNVMKTCTNLDFGNGCNGYGYGTMRYLFAGKTYYGHAGDISGFTQLSIHHPTEALTLSISINRNNAPRGPIALALIRALEEALTVSVPDPSNTAFFRVYPNPAKENIFIELKTFQNQLTGTKVAIFNSFGTLTYKDQVNLHSGRIQIDTSGFTPGVFFIVIYNEKESYTEKIVIY